MDVVKQNGKALAALLAALLGWVSSVVVSNSTDITSGEWVQLAAVFVTAAIVWLTKNAPPDPL